MDMKHGRPLGLLPSSKAGSGLRAGVAALVVQDLREKIDAHYRVRLILDNLPITTYDLEENPESIRPGYEVGYKGEDGKYYLNNHLMFKILVHRTHGQYSRARENMAELEAAAVVEVNPLARGTAWPLLHAWGAFCVSLSCAAVSQRSAPQKTGPVAIVVLLDCCSVLLLKVRVNTLQIHLLCVHTPGSGML